MPRALTLKVWSDNCHPKSLLNTGSWFHCQLLPQTEESKLFKCPRWFGYWWLRILVLETNIAWPHLDVESKVVKLIETKRIVDVRGWSGSGEMLFKGTVFSCVWWTNLGDLMCNTVAKATCHHRKSNYMWVKCSDNFTMCVCVCVCVYIYQTSSCTLQIKYI
jgi:hypothetical protein